MIRDGGVPENAEKFTHAPHARRGFFPICRETHLLYFYSRASCEARRCGRALECCYHGRFLLTRLMRGATTSAYIQTRLTVISTHAPHARRDTAFHRFLMECQISTHAPHARRDYKFLCVGLVRVNFYSRASCEARQRAVRSAYSPF